MALIIFVRHGQTNDNITGRISSLSPVPLNARGLQQARLASQVLAPLGVTHLWCSPVLRARWTAEILAERLQRSIEDVPELSEVGYGDWQGERFSEMQADPIAQLVGHDPARVMFPNGERLLDVQQRGIRVVESVCYRYPHDTVVLVTHGDVIRTALAYYLGLTFNDYRHLTVDNGALSVVERDENGSRVKAMNVVPSPGHLGRFPPG